MPPFPGDLGLLHAYILLNFSLVHVVRKNLGEQGAAKDRFVPQLNEDSLRDLSSVAEAVEKHYV